MRTLALLAAILAAPPAVHAQANPSGTPAPDGAIVESAQVSGLSLDELSPGLRQAIGALAGQPLDRAAINALAVRIEEERPDVVAAARDVAQPDGRVRVVFLVARISEDADLAENINARYTVERVEVALVDDRAISNELHDDLQALVGRPLDPE